MTGIEVPLEVATVLCVGCVAIGVWTGRVRAARESNPRGNVLSERLGELLKAEARTNTIDLAIRRDAVRAESRAVLEAKIDPLCAQPGSLNADNRKQMRDHVAAVMRAGLRRGDRVTLAEGDGFTIILPGTDERSAVRIADRLRRKLARMTWPNLSAGAGLSARFGVAAGRHGQPVDNIAARARRALDAAWDHGNVHVIPASAIEEILLLPPPAAAVSAAA
ncbi:GGDEF domain-containing protein [Erythrobacter donghaensis]|uniref:GGDEF domain-containing protein n=1 Tax=Erythrobacter donghaensis TaxID=267135 RepID=UPI000A39D665|nr:diguanylate cyclase [Erythrobacter donghaensis]